MKAWPGNHPLARALFVSVAALAVTPFVVALAFLAASTVTALLVANAIDSALD